MGYSREGLEAMTKDQLKGIATDAGLEVAGQKKSDFVDAILAGTEGEEFEGTDEETNTEAPVAVEKEVFHLADGSECSKSAFVREQFLEFNLSRKDISEKFDIPYRTVYGATVNMENEAEPAGRGRKAGSAIIYVGGTNQVLTVVDDQVFLNEELVEGAIASPVVENVVQVALLDGTSVAFIGTDRNTWIKESVDAGESRGDVAKALGVSFGVVYGITKDQAGTRAKHMVEIEDPENAGVMIEISRNDYIRQLFAEGMKKADIAKQLEVEYAVVWAATKADKTDNERYQDVLEKLKKFAELVEEADTEHFNQAFDTLVAIVIPEPVEEVEEATAETVAE